MADALPNPQDSLAASATTRESVIAAFEDAWQHGKQPSPSDLLPSGPLDLRLLTELGHIDLEYRLKAGQNARAEDHLSRWPALANDAERAVELIEAEARLRQRAEPSLGLDEYLRRFPFRNMPTRCADGWGSSLPGHPKTQTWYPHRPIATCSLASWRYRWISSAATD
jgi:hypothetical protein